MKDREKQKAQLVSELATMRQRTAELEIIETECIRVSETLQENQAEFSAIFYNAPVMMVLIDQDRKVRKANHAMVSFTHRPAEEMVGVRSGEIFRCLNSMDDPRGCGFSPACEPCLLRSVVSDAFETGQSHQRVETKLTLVREGQREDKIFLVSTTPLSVSDTPMVIVYIEDITEQKQTEKALQESQAQFQDLYRNAPNAYFSVGIDGLIHRCNRRAEELLGYGTKELVGRSVSELYADTLQGKKKASEIFQQFRAGKIIRDEELQMQKADGTLVWISLTVNPIRDAGGQVIESRSMVVDITERKRAEEKIRGLAKFPSENPTPVMRIAQDGSILYANDASLPILNFWGCKMDQCLSDDWHNLISDTLSSGSGKDTEIEYKGRTFFLTFAPIMDAGYVNVYGLDITDRKKTDRALQESEERYRWITQNMSDYVYSALIHPDGQVETEWIIGALESISGYTFEETQTLANGFFSIVHKDDLAKVHLIQSQLLEDQSQSVEFRIFTKNGEIRWLRDYIRPVWDAEEQRVVRLLGGVQDITKRKRAEDILRRRNLELALLNQVGRELVATLDLEQVTERLLQAVTETIGAEGASVWLWDGEQNEWLVCRAAFHQGQSRPPVDLRVGTGQGIAGWVAQKGQGIITSAPDDPRFFSGIDEQIDFQTMSLLAVPLQVRDEVIGVLEVVNKQQGDFDEDDLTLIETLAASAAIAIDHTELVETLRGRNTELESRNEELDAFAHTVAHDLKNPLGIITGLAGVLEEDHASLTDEELPRYLRTVARNGRKINRIIDELLLLAVVRKLEEVEMIPLDMAGIVAEAQNRLTDVIEGSQAEIVLPDTWPIAPGYDPWVEEIWANYLSNAIKYGGQPPYIELGATEQTDGTIRFWVRDNGPGLTLEEQARLFTPFTRLDQVRAKGHGLGLSIVRRIAEKLGGQVGVESEVGKGSIFFFTLPVHRSDLNPIVIQP